MGRGSLRFGAWTLAAVSPLLIAACGSSDEDPNSRSGAPENGGTSGTTDPAGTVTTPEEQVRKILDSRRTDYGEALRTASLKLRDRLPDLAEIKQIQAAGDEPAKKVAYEKLVDDMLNAPEFPRAMIKFWRDTFRLAQVGAPTNNVNKDGAPNFAAQVTVEGRSYSELFTATENTCPTFDGEQNKFNPASCAMANGAIAGPTVGLLTDPGVQAQYAANMAFRRVRFVQETFVCSKFPAEYAPTPVPMGNGSYTALMPFTSITGKEENKPDPKVDFRDTKAVVCANCHANMNHVAPLFLNWDMNGALKAGPQMKIPIPGEPIANRNDYLPEGEPLAWRSGKTLTDMGSLGQALATDPDVARCAVNRIWNYAMSRGDIVNDLASVPTPVTQPYVERFTAGGSKLKETIRDVFKSEDFTKF